MRLDLCTWAATRGLAECLCRSRGVVGRVLAGDALDAACVFGSSRGTNRDAMQVSEMVAYGLPQLQGGGR